MATFDHSNTNKFKALAAAVALVLHGLAGYGLTHMTMLNIEPPKITLPLEIQMIALNSEESPEPLPVEVPEPTPTPTPTPKSVSAPAPPKFAPPPKVEPVKPPPKVEKPEPKKEPPKKESPKEVVKKEPKQEQPKPEVDLLAQQKAQKTFELQQAQEREREHEKEQERAREREQEGARKKAQQEAENAKKQAQQGQGKGGDGKDTKTDNKDKGDKTAKKGDDKGNDKGDKGDKDGGELKGQNLSISNASWQRRPSWGGLTSEKLSGSASFTATLTIDANGGITAVSGVNTGDKALDKQIVQAIKRAKLKPFKSSSGQPMSGTAFFGATVNF